MQELDLLAKQIILKRDLNRCVKCGTEKNLQAAHILPKGMYQRMRFMPFNLLTLCLKDHLFFAHKDPCGFSRWLEEKYPGRYDQLLMWSRQMPKLDLKQIRIDLEALAELESQP